MKTARIALIILGAAFVLGAFGVMAGRGNQPPEYHNVPGIDLWDYTKTVDPMGRGISRTATIESEPTLFDAMKPPRRALLLATNDVGEEPWITVHVDGAHFQCGDFAHPNCDVLVRFDNNAAYETPAFAANDRGSIGMSDGANLMRALGQSKVFRVELPLESAATIVKFNARGFPADKMLLTPQQDDSAGKP